MYSVARTLTTSSPEQVESWPDHYSQIRVRLFVLFTCWVVALALLGWLALEIPFIHPLRAVQVSGIVILTAAALWANPTFQAVVANTFLIALIGRIAWTSFSADIF